MNGGASNLKFEVVFGMESFSRDQWHELEGTNRGKQGYNPFVSHAFIMALQNSGCVGPGTGWSPHFLSVTNSSKELVAAVPAYLKSHSQGEYVFDQGWADALNRAGGQYYPKLQIAVPFTPVGSPRLIVKPGHTDLKRHLPIVLSQITDKAGLSSAHATFLLDDDLEAFRGQGWLTRLDHQFHFFNRNYRDYQDFLDSLASRKRKSLRRERETALGNGIEVDLYTGGDLTEAIWDSFYAFYMDTGSRKWGRPYLNRIFFSLIGQTMADDILLVMARRNGRHIAGAINFIGDGRLFGRNWGCIEDHPFLHFEICYHQAIEFAIRNKLHVVEAGAQGAHKLTRGYEPVMTYSAHHIGHVGLKRAVEAYLKEEAAEVRNMGNSLSMHLPFRKDNRLTAMREMED